MEYFLKNFDLVHFLNYEMFNPNDSFGKMMVKNFQVRLRVSSHQLASALSFSWPILKEALPRFLLHCLAFSGL